MKHSDTSKSVVLDRYLDSLHEPSTEASTPTNTTAPKSNSGRATPLRHSTISKIYELSNQNLDSADALQPRHDKRLVLFYQKLLQLKLVSITLQPLFRIVASSQSFFPNHVLGEGNTARYVDECVALSPDGSLLLCVKRDQLNNHFLWTICLDDSSQNKDFIPYLKSVHSWTNDRAVRAVVLSRDLNYLAISYHVGYVEVHDLGIAQFSFVSAPLKNYPVNLNGTSSFAQSTLCVFHSQYPSSISYLALSANCEVLFLRSQRLGGLIVVNLQTGDVIDIPHYRLDLTMSLQFNDKVLLLSGWNETIIFGKATPSSPDVLPKPGTLWEYFHSLIQNNISSYVPVEKAIALEKPNAYLGFDCSQTGGFNLKIILDEDELIGFTPLENIGDEDEEDVEDVGDGEDGEEEESTNGEIPTEGESTTDEQANETVPRSSSPSDTSLVELTDQSLTPNPNDEEDDQDGDDPEEDDDRRSCTLLKRRTMALNDVIYCMSSNGLRLAIVFQSSIFIYVLREHTIDDALVTGFLAYRQFKVSLFKNIGSGTVSFVGNDKLLAMTQDRIVIYELSSDAKWTASGQQQFKYLKINADNNLELI